jgi:hypothetical protein
LDSRSTGPFARADDYDQIYAASLECPWSGGEKRFRGAYAYLGSDNPAGDNASGCLCHALGIGGSRCGTEGVSRVHTFIGPMLRAVGCCEQFSPASVDRGHVSGKETAQ